MKQAERKQVLQRMYKGRPIDGIILIDDAVDSLVSDAIRERIGGAGAEAIDELHKLGMPDGLASHAASETQWRHAIESLDPQEMRAALKAIHGKYQSKLQKDVRSLSDLHETVVVCAPDDFEGAKDAFENDKIWLFIVDLHLQGDNDKDGLRVVQEIAAKRNDCPRILLSGDFKDAHYSKYEEVAGLEDEDKDLLRTHGVVLLSRFHLLAESSGSPDNSQDEVRLEILHYSLFKPELDAFRKEMKDRIRGAMQVAQERLDEIKPLDYEQVVFSSSTGDGRWPPFTALSVALRHIEAAFYQQDTDPLPTRKLIEANRAMSNGKGLLYTHIAYDEAKVLNRQQYQYGPEINKARLPLGNGDLFRLPEGNDYILIAQPCDIQVRWSGSDGATVRKQTEAGLLLPIIEPGGSLDAPRWYKLSGRNRDGDNRYVDCAKPLHVDLKVLDLCAANPDGCAVAGNQDPGHWSPVYEAHLRASHKDDIVPASMVIQAYHAAKQAMLKKANASDEDWPATATAEPANPPWVSPIVSKWNKDDIVFKADVTRVGRLNDAEAQLVLQAFHHYHSRPGLEAPLMLTKSNKDSQVCQNCGFCE